MNPYIPINREQENQMLDFLGLKNIDQLFQAIPQELLLKEELLLPKGLSEPDLIKHMTKLSQKNKTIDEQICFLGAGAYDRYIPSIISHLVSRSEFYTAYTPYQPEISQGTLQAIFEFQSMIAELTGTEVANASMYDGASACAEAVLMASKHTKKKKILISDGVHPETKSVVSTYAKFNNIELEYIKLKDGSTSVQELEKLMNDDIGGIVIQSPNFFGQVENLDAIEQIIHSQKALMITSISDPLAYVFLEPPGTIGSDIVVGEGQSLGLKLNFGGPNLGFMCASKKLMRKLPGRIVGETTDVDGNKAFVLTLQAREQHIRREKATSNICSNQGLNALIATIYMATMGKNGLMKAAQQNLSKSRYALEEFKKIGLRPYFSGPFFNEFLLDLGVDASIIYERLSQKGILCGLPLTNILNSPTVEKAENKLLVCVTEKRSRQEIDALVSETGRMVRR